MNRILNYRVEVFLVILVTTLLFWGSSYSFFWRDDWDFLAGIQQDGFKFIFQPFNKQHILPVFKLLYWLEVSVYGTNTFLYQLTNHIVFALAVFYLWKTVKLFKTSIDFLLLPAILLVATHPVNNITLLWSFQVNQSLHILLQIVSVYYFIKFDQSELQNKRYFILSTVFLILQNYALGNGFLLPLVFLSYLILFFKGIKYYAGIYIILFITFFLIQAFIGVSSDILSQFANNPLKYVYAYLRYLDINLARLFFITDLLHIRYLPILFGFSVALVFYFRRIKENKYLTLALLWFLCSGLSVPLVRDISTEIPYYYTFLQLFPVFVLIIQILLSLEVNKYSLQLSSLCVFLMVAYYFIDRRMVNVFTVRNVLNESRMYEAIDKNKKYVPFDDPHVSESGLYAKRDAKDTFLYWHQATPVHINSYLENSTISE